MLDLDANTLTDLLPYAQLIEAVADAFAGEAFAPERSHYHVPVPGKAEGNLLLMPAWQPGEALGVKIATVFPDNAQQSLPAVFASYVLMDPATGRPDAIMDGAELTLRRTAAASALASRFLSREDSATHLMVGTGKLAPHLIEAHAVVRDIREVLIWGRNPEAAAELAANLDFKARVTAIEDLRSAVQQADIISTANACNEPTGSG